MSALAVLKDAWQGRGTLGDANTTRELKAFLPAALEIQETPPNPAVRRLAWSLLALVLFSLLWACFGKVNVVASAEGKIIPSSRVKQIQPVNKAVVKSIFVEDGEYVSQGQPLIELDSTLTKADENRVASELNGAKLELAVHQAFLGILDMSVEEQVELAANSVPLQVDFPISRDQLVLHKRLVLKQWEQYQGKLNGLHSSLNASKARQAATREIIRKIEQTLPIITRRSNTIEDLYHKGFASETDYLKLEQERIQQAQNLAIEKQSLNEFIAQTSETRQSVRSFTAQVYADKLASIAELYVQVAALREELVKASNSNSNQVLYAPIAGKVQELAVNTEGGVVTVAQQLMLIVPDGESLEVEVFLENKDIGFVREAMPAEIKVHTFPFTKYGVIDGEVMTVSSDAIVDKKRGLVYGMRLLMSKNTISVDGKDVSLIPGMAVTAEVQVGSRRIIEFFLAPLLRHSKESLRER